MRDFFRFIAFFYDLVGFRLVLLVFIVAGAAFTELVGLSMFMPLLQQNDIDSRMAATISAAFDTLGLPYSMTSLLALIVLLFFVSAGFLIFKTMYVAHLVVKLLVKVRIALVDRLFTASYEYVMQKDVGYLNNAVVVEYQRVAFAFQQLAYVIVGLVFMVFYLALPLVLSPLILGILFAVGVPSLFVVRKLNLETKKYSIENSAQSARLQEFLIQALHNFKYLKSTFSQERIVSRVNSAIAELGKVLYRLWVLAGISHYGFTPFTILAVAALLYIQVEIRQMEMVETLFVLYLLKRALDQLVAVQRNYRKFLSSFGGIKVLETLEAEVSQAQEDLEREGGVPDFGQSIRLDRVSFEYRSGGYALRDITLAIEPNSTVAFVGGSGAGKSTLVTLLTGILTPTEGDISIGGLSYNEIDQRLLRSGIGYVTQEGAIFNDTIKNNITLWSDDVPDDRVRLAALASHIDEFIEKLPNSYGSVLGTNGINISGGQRQRINIARELYKDVSLMILDEATSSLDSESERAIQRNIDEFRGKKTIVLIAHRLSTVKSADVIFVLKDGSLVEHGTYQQLYGRRGEFRRMVDLQVLESPHAEQRV